MKASDFVGYFDFSLEKEHGFHDEEEYNYFATDNQGVFETRYALNIEDLADGFEGIAYDWILEDIEEDGFEEIPGKDFWQSAYEFCQENDYDTFVEIIDCIRNPKLLVA